MSPALEQAQKLLGQDPLPTDIEAQLELLEGQIAPGEEEMFGDLWEALEVALGPADPA